MLGAVLHGVHDLDSVVRPLHTSFSNFLRDPERCQAQFFVRSEDTNASFATGCLQTMNRELRFDICSIPTSFKRNCDIEGIADLIRANISMALSYSCQFWTRHVFPLGLLNSMLNGLVMELLDVHFLEWLEAMSLLGASPYMALLELKSQPFHVSIVVTALFNISTKYNQQEIGNLSERIQDASRFCFTNAEVIAQSATHIYLSALPFTPQSSLSHSYLEQFPRTGNLSARKPSAWPNVVRQFRCPNSRSKAVGFSRSATLVAAAGADNQINIWTLHTGELAMSPLAGHLREINSIAFSPDDTMVTSSSWDGSVQIWSLSEGIQITVLPSDNGEFFPRAIAFTPTALISQLAIPVTPFKYGSTPGWNLDRNVEYFKDTLV